MPGVARQGNIIQHRRGSSFAQVRLVMRQVRLVTWLHVRLVTPRHACLTDAVGITSSQYAVLFSRSSDAAHGCGWIAWRSAMAETAAAPPPAPPGLTRLHAIIVEHHGSSSCACACACCLLSSSSACVSSSAPELRGHPVSAHSERAPSRPALGEPTCAGRADLRWASRPALGEPTCVPRPQVCVGLGLWLTPLRARRPRCHRAGPRASPARAGAGRAPRWPAGAARACTPTRGPSRSRQPSPRRRARSTR